MKHAVDCKELSQEFMTLDSKNRDYVLAIARALAFAQKTTTAPPPETECEQQKGA